ncbi:hypothetical protein KY360_04520 [Candidatus Woesearchaeota archaeon]|nr:hypothetical protein [Candidatus Woesearchaeota archaeon]
MKKALIIALCLLVLGCARTPTGDFIEGNEDQVINCGDCDDGDKCTTDICAGENKTCTNIPIRRCCGNNQCEIGETCLTCVPDCGECYTMVKFQKDVNKLYDRKIFFTPNKAVGKSFGEATSPDYDFYDSTYVTVIEMKNEEKFFLTFKDFGDFVRDIAEARFDKFTAKIAELYPEQDYELVTNYSIEVTGTLGGDMIVYGQWAKIYKKFRSCAICNINNESYETLRLDEPVIEGVVYIRCAPDLAAAFYSNQPQMLEKFWTNLDEEEYDAQVETWLDREARGAYDEAATMLGYCS